MITKSSDLKNYSTNFLIWQSIFVKKEQNIVLGIEIDYTYVRFSAKFGHEKTHGIVMSGV